MRHKLDTAGRPSLLALLFGPPQPRAPCLGPRKTARGTRAQSQRRQIHASRRRILSINCGTSRGLTTVCSGHTSTTVPVLRPSQEVVHDMLELVASALCEGSHGISKPAGTLRGPVKFFVDGPIRLVGQGKSLGNDSLSASKPLWDVVSTLSLRDIPFHSAPVSPGTWLGHCRFGPQPATDHQCLRRPSRG